MSALTPILSSPGWELLELLQAKQATNPIPLPELGSTLRASSLDTDLVVAALTQLALRQAARLKLGPFVSRMAFTRDGFEQATRLVVATRHAQQFKDRGATRVADPGCGIGSDAMAIAGLDMNVLAIDIDPDTAGATAVNLRAFERSEIRLGDVANLDMDELASEGVDAIFADPTRRTGASRGSAHITDPQQWSPLLSFALDWAPTIERVGIKVVPGIVYERIPSSWHAQWANVGGGLVETSLWSPALSPEGRGRSYLLLDEVGAAHSLSTPEGYAPSASAAHVGVAPLGVMVAESDSAVIRSGLLGRLADEVDAGIVPDKTAYPTGDELPDCPLYDRLEVLAVANLRAKAISAKLRTRGAGSVEIKERGADISPDDLRKSLRPGGGNERLTVIVTRVNERHRAVICRRLAKNL